MHTYVLTTNNQGGGNSVVTVQVSHGSVRIDSIVVTLAPSNNTAPTAIGFSPASLTAGSLSAGQNVGTLTCTDAESATCSYVLSAQSASGAFAVAANGAVTVANAGLAAGSYTITVVAADAGGLTKTSTQTIVVSAAPGLDSTPDLFDISNMSNQTINTVVTTNAVTVSGINTSVTASTTLGTIVKNGSDTGSSSTTVVAGNTVAVKLTTSASYATALNGTLTIGAGTDNFSVTTEALSLPAAPALTTSGLYANAGNQYLNIANQSTATFNV